MKTNLYFAYGANLSREDMQYRCPNARPLEQLYLKDWRLTFSRVATIQPVPGQSVPGAIWEITQECEDNLDVFEGFPFLYSKVYLQQDGMEFMAYVMNDDPPAPPGKSYYDTIAQGYRDWGLPLGKLAAARESTRLECI